MELDEHPSFILREFPVSVIRFPKLDRSIIITAGESKGAATTSSTGSLVSSVAPPPHAANTRRSIEKIIIPCFRDGFIFSPFFN